MLDVIFWVDSADPKKSRAKFYAPKISRLTIQKLMCMITNMKIYLSQNNFEHKNYLNQLKFYIYIREPRTLMIQNDAAILNQVFFNCPIKILTSYLFPFDHYENSNQSSSKIASITNSYIFERGSTKSRIQPKINKRMS